MARVLRVSASGFHAWRSRPASAPAQADAALLRRIRTIHAGSRGTCGAPRVHAGLQAEGTAIARKRVAHPMRHAGLRGVSRRRFPDHDAARTDAQAGQRPRRPGVHRSGPNLPRVADITRAPPSAGFLFLAVVLDDWSRRIIGLGYGHGSANAPGARRARHGGDHQETGRCRASQRPGQPIRVAGLRDAMPGSRRASIHRTCISLPDQTAVGALARAVSIIRRRAGVKRAAAGAGRRAHL
jgi:transposase InsO family protein